MRDIDPVDLDNYITGHYGADQFDEYEDFEYGNWEEPEDDFDPEEVEDEDYLPYEELDYYEEEDYYDFPENWDEWPTGDDVW